MTMMDVMYQYKLDWVEELFHNIFLDNQPQYHLVFYLVNARNYQKLIGECINI